MKTQLIIVLNSLLLVGLLSSCASIGGKAGKIVSAAALLDIEKGSPTEDLVALLGKPLSIEYHDNGPVPMQVWYYAAEKSVTDELRYDNIAEPSIVRIRKTTSVVQVIIVENLVVGWKVDRAQKSDIYK